jgi:hypothetical protein
MSAHAGNRPESLGWYKVYEWTSFVDVATFAYTINNSATAPAFTRVLYQMCFGDYAVWCEMDDFTSGNALQVGVPLTWVYETNVNNLKVYVNKNATSYPEANASTIYSRESALGRINFWPSNYGTTGGNSSLYDHDDDSYSVGDGYGSMQVFDMIPTTPECIFAWNYWGGASGGDLGMGNRSTSHPDWTFTNNLNSIGPRFGRVYVR